MARHIAVMTLATLTFAGHAAAQTSNCVNIGGGMVHCDNMGPNGSTSSTNCTDTGGGTANCNTMNTGNGLNHPRTGGTSTLSFIAGLIAQSQERSFQTKIATLLSSGDCRGAANLAIAKGRYDMSNQIRQTCDAPPVPEELEKKVENWVAESKSTIVFPMVINSTTTGTNIEAIGTQILYSFNINDGAETISGRRRIKVQNNICATFPPELLKAGVSFRFKYFDLSGIELGSIMITRSDCGL